jgi:hypothetical protein
VDHPIVTGGDDGDPGLLELAGVGLAFVAQRVVLRGVSTPYYLMPLVLLSMWTLLSSFFKTDPRLIAISAYVEPLRLGGDLFLSRLN